MGDEAIAKDHVSGTEASGIGAAEDHGVLGHFRIERLAIGAIEWRGEHVVAEPVAEPMAALFVVRPVSHDGMKGH